MNIIGHITFEMSSTSSWSLLLKSDKTVGMRLMKRPIITTRPDKSFCLDGFLRTMRILEENKTKQKNRWDLSALFLTSVGLPLPSAGASVHKLLFPFRLLFAWSNLQWNVEPGGGGVGILQKSYFYCSYRDTILRGITATVMTPICCVKYCSQKFHLQITQNHVCTEHLLFSFSSVRIHS